MTIDKQDYFAFDVDDIYDRESAIDYITESTKNAGFALADKLDIYLAGLVKSNATIKLDTSSSNKLALTGSNGLELLATITEKLDDNNAPESRWCVVPNNVARLLTLELAGKLNQNAELLKTGYIGSLFGLNLYKSNNVSQILFGTRECGTFANVISNTEAIRREKSFSTSIRGLHVYGAKITRPSITGCIYVEESTSSAS